MPLTPRFLQIQDFILCALVEFCMPVFWIAIVMETPTLENLSTDLPIDLCKKVRLLISSYDYTIRKGVLAFYKPPPPN